MSSSPSTVLSLTLDLNSQAHAPAPGVLKTLDLVAGASHDFDLHLRVVHGSSVLKFSFTGLEDAPTRATVESPDLNGSTKTPEIDTRQSKRDKIKDVDKQISSLPNNDDAESLDSDEPLATQKRQRAKPLHHPVVGNESYGETSDEIPSKNKSHKRRHLRSKRPPPGAYVEPPKNARDILESDSDILDPPHTNTPRPKMIGAPNTSIRTPQKYLDTYVFRAGSQIQTSMKKMPDLYVGLESAGGLDANLAQNPQSAKHSRRFQRSEPPERDLGPSVAKRER